MRAFSTILVCGAILTLGGCKSDSQTGIDPAQELAAARVAKVPLPASTPFDASPSARSAYLEAYRDGYRSGLVSLNVLIGKPAIGDTYYLARTNGWQTGVSAGFGSRFTEMMQKGHHQ